MNEKRVHTALSESDEEPTPGNFNPATRTGNRTAHKARLSTVSEQNNL
jgi:hypothetical protein